MVLMSEAPLDVEDIDAPDDDVNDNDDAPLQEFRRCLQAMASGKNIRKLRAWRTDCFALKGSRKEGNGKGMTRTLNEKQEQRIPPIVPGCPMPMVTRYDFEVPLHRRFTALLTSATSSPFVLGRRIFGTRRLRGRVTFGR